MNCVDRDSAGRARRYSPEIERMIANVTASRLIPATYREAIAGLLEASQDSGIAGEASCAIIPDRFPDLRTAFASMELPDGSGQLCDDRIYLKLAPFDVKLQRTEEGLVCDIYGTDDAECLASCYAFNQDAGGFGQDC